jgi:hypothetical protein
MAGESGRGWVQAVKSIMVGFNYKDQSMTYEIRRRHPDIVATACAV